MDFRFSFPSHSRLSTPFPLSGSSLRHRRLASINMEKFLTDLTAILLEHLDTSVSLDASLRAIPRALPAASMFMNPSCPKFLPLALLL